MRKFWMIVFTALLSGCTVPLSQGGLPTLCGTLTTTGGSAVGGVTGAFLAGNSVTNNVVTTKQGAKFITTVTKKNASNGTVALYTLGGVLGGAVIAGTAAHYMCPAAAPTATPAKGITENERLHQDDLSMR